MSGAAARRTIANRLTHRFGFYGRGRLRGVYRAFAQNQFSFRRSSRMPSLDGVGGFDFDYRGKVLVHIPRHMNKQGQAESPRKARFENGDSRLDFSAEAEGKAYPYRTELVGTTRGSISRLGILIVGVRDGQLKLSPARSARLRDQSSRASVRRPAARPRAALAGRLKVSAWGDNHTSLFGTMNVEMTASA